GVTCSKGSARTLRFDRSEDFRTLDPALLLGRVSASGPSPAAEQTGTQSVWDGQSLTAAERRLTAVKVLPFSRRRSGAACLHRCRFIRGHRSMKVFCASPP